MRLALVDDFIFWVGLTDSMKEMIDSYEDNIESLADIEGYRLLAQGLIELDTVTAFFSSENQSYRQIKEEFEQHGGGDIASYQEFVAELESEVKLKPYLALATGVGIDEKGYYLAIVLLNPSDEVAQENTTLLEQRIGQAETTAWGSAGGRRWADIIQGMDIESRGRLTLARLYGQACTYWDDFVVRGELPYEPLLIHE